MKNLPLEYYEKWPNARKAVIFYNAAQKANKGENRYLGSWEVSYYLLSHAMELSIKSIAQLKTGEVPVWIHDKEELSQKYKKECGFSDQELITIKELKDLNNGPGGLRYENSIKGEFYPHTFENGSLIIARLLEIFENESSK